MENCNTSSCRTKPILTIQTIGTPSISNMEKRNYDIFIDTLVAMTRTHIENEQFRLLQKDGDNYD